MATAESRSNQVVAAIRDILVDHLHEKIDAGGMSKKNYHLQGQAAGIDAAQCPAICLDDRGSVLLWESIRGRNADGTLAAGVREDQYSINLQLWLVGRKGADMREEFNRWRDGITACLGANWSAYDGAQQITVDDSTPEFSTTISGATLWVGEVGITANVMSAQGATTILNST